MERDLLQMANFKGKDGEGCEGEARLSEDGMG